MQLHTCFWQPRKSLLVRLVIFVVRYSREKVTNSNVTEPFGIFIIWANRVSAPKSDALCYWPNISDYIKGHFHPSKWFSTLKFLQIKFKREKLISRQIKTPRKKKKNFMSKKSSGLWRLPVNLTFFSLTHEDEVIQVCHIYFVGTCPSVDKPHITPRLAALDNNFFR